MLELSSLIQHQLIPWSRQNVSSRFIVAHSEMSAATLPPGVKLLKHKIQEKRTVVKNRRDYSNTRGFTARWGDAGLNEVPKLKLACVLNGHIDYLLSSYRLQCGPGHFIFIPPDIPHSDGTRPYVDTTKSRFCEVMFFLLHPNALQCWISHSQPGQRKQQLGNYLIFHERTMLLFRGLMEEVIEGEKNSLSIGEELLWAFLSVLQREADNERLQPVRNNAVEYPYEGISPYSLSADFATRLEQYIQSNLHKALTTDNAAREMFFSRAQFTRNVRRTTGMSFNELLNHYRIEEAKKLLTTTQWTASAIAAFIGFKSPSYFRTFFREHTGSTPSEFRLTAKDAINKEV